MALADACETTPGFGSIAPREHLPSLCIVRETAQSIAADKKRCICVKRSAAVRSDGVYGCRCAEGEWHNIL